MSDDPKPAPSKIISQDGLQVINDLSDLKKYRTELPNLYDDAGLSPYEYRLLGHYKRVGRCTESTRTTAKKCKMSTGMVSKARQALADGGWVTLEAVPVPEGFSYVVQVVDRWVENFASFSGIGIDEIKSILDTLPNRSPHERYSSQGERYRSPCETKKELIKKLKQEEEGAQKPNLFKVYEQEIGAITPLIADALKDAEKEYPPGWVEEAIQIAVERNVRNWKYVRAVLEDCKAKKVSPKLNTKGKSNAKPNQSGSKSDAKPSAKPSQSVVDEINRRRREKGMR